ncbi:MAG TPA: zf-HC2 domain-containing protein, partial [Gemmatimonadaceae bacterium]|nr:zf-HC2 domain-containing protein [Gemmatimonadaceae bacterium]
MNDCVKAEVRDALPDFINHRLSELDAATMREHIESCADCKAELELIRQARAAALLAPKMNVDRIAAALPSYSSAGSPYS